MAVISPTLINYYADQAGFRGNARTIAVAVALAESGGNTTARHLNTNGTWDTGLWQINSVHTQYNQQLLLDPAYNARAAFAISSGGSNWHPWTTYNTGAYQRFMGTASGAPGNATPPPTVGKPGQGAAAAMTVDQVFTSKGLWKWYSSRVTQGFNGVNEKGEDFATSWGAPVGVVMGGKVVRSVHNNNSIGDVVEIQAGDGSVWLYQHIRSRVAPGKLVSTGDIVGTEDGLPRDQYSTGPHIEVRYCPPGRWSASTGSWTEPWINPRAIFSAVGAMHATGPNVTTGPGSPTTPGGPAGTTTSAFITNISVPGPSTYVPLLDQVHETLVNHPGFYGIALTLDEAEQFPGYIDLTRPAEIDTVVGKFPMPDISGTVRSVGATVTDNFLPFAIRSGLVLLGMALVFALVIKPVMQVAGPIAEVLAA